MCFRSALNACRSSSLAKYLFDRPHSVMVLDHAADQLLHAALTLRRADLAAEVLGDHDVGGLLRPRLRNLDVALLEDHLAPLVADHRGAQLPFDLIERVDARLGEETRKCQPSRGSLLRPRLVRVDERRYASTALDRLLAGTDGLISSAVLHVPTPIAPGIAGERPATPCPGVAVICCGFGAALSREAGEFSLKPGRATAVKYARD